MISSKGYRVSVVVFGALLSLLFAVYVDQLERNRTMHIFESHADDTLKALTNRLDGYSRTLDGAAALFPASTVVTESDWERYVKTLDIEDKMSGILGVGYITVLRDSASLDLSEPVIHQGQLLPSIHPDTGLDERFVIQFIEPKEENITAYGLDMGFEPERRASAQAARDTNTVRLTPPIELVQNEGRELGFLVLRPRYNTDADLSSPQAREDAFQGWVYMPFIGTALFTSLTAQHESAASLTVSDHGADGNVIRVFSNLSDDHTPRFSISRNVELYGRDWALTWDSTAAFESANTGPAKWIVGILGLIVFGLLGLVLRVISHREDRIEMDVARKTEEIRAKTEETLSVIHNAVIAILVLDPNEKILSANQTAQQLFSMGSVKPGTAIEDVIVLNHDVGPAGDTARCARSPLDPNLRLRVQKNDWMTANGAIRSTLLVQDVSESEASARELASNEARWNLALEGAQIGVFDLDLTTNRSVVSDTWRKLMKAPLDATDFDPQEFFLSRVHPDDRHTLHIVNKDCIEGKNDRSVAEYRVKFDDGSIRWMKSDAVVVARDANGKALRLVGSQTDQTDFRNARNALRASRERFELVVKQAPVGMALFSTGGHFLGMNEALCRMTGYAENELRGEMRFRDLLSPSDFRTVLRAISKLKSEQQSSYQNECQIIPKNGPPIWGLLSIAWTFDPVRETEVFIVQINDINEKKNIEKMKAEFVATVSHELRTPLTSIKGALGLLRGPMVSNMPTGAERLLEIAASNTDRLSELVNDILDLEKIRSGEVEFYIEPVHLQPLLSDSMEQMLTFAVQHKIEFVMEAPRTPVIAIIDPQRTQQVVANLLSNACKYSDDNSKVHIRLETVGDQALICVLNTGPVISDDFKLKVFEPFSQADASDTRAKGGTGLGLNISRQIVERMNGKIGFKSEAKTPNAFWFTVPLAREGMLTVDDAAFPTTPPSVIRVLHLEDDPDFAEIIRKGFGARADMTSVVTIGEARAAIRSAEFDLVVIDWELPDGHGREVLDDVVKYQPHARIMSLSAQEMSVRDLRIDHEIVKSRTDLEDIVSQMVNYSLTA